MDHDQGGAVRWPAGLHAQSGSLRAVGSRPQRYRATPQAEYWRQTATELHASASAAFPRFIPLGPQFTVSASTGPTAAGEQWVVTQAQVQTNVGYGQDPLVAQQIVAQAEGAVTTPPPPVPVQVWLSAAGVKLHLLAQSTQGGYDNLALAGQVVRPGEAITVTWWITGETLSPAIVTSAWFVLRGTRYALSAQ